MRAYVLLVLMLACTLAFASADELSTGITHAPRIRAGKDDTSINWGGYAVTAHNGAVSDVKGSWIVPAVTCPPNANSQYSSFWVGIDGYSSNTVEQTGTDSDCIKGVPTYYAWYEFYPKPSFLIKGITVKAGDVMFGEVQYSGGKYVATIIDETTGKSFSTSAKVNNAKASSAEWIFEAPYSGGILPLANFGTAYFGVDYTSIASTSYATISGVTGSINSFGSNVQPITMVNSAGGVKAFPSALSSDGTSFSGTWQSN